jgi:AcrR family transcriptional regulator
MSENPAMASSGRAPDHLPDVPAAGTFAGLRERKKQKTRDAIQREAMRLFQEQGYEATTIEQIAAAVDISPSTFFNYFPTKEDVVFNDPYDPMLISMFRARPRDESLGIAVRRTIVEGLATAFQHDREIILGRARLMMGVPALRARIWEELERSQVLLCTVIAERIGCDPDDFELRVTTMMMMGAIFAAELEWLRRGGREDLPGVVDRAFEVAEVGARLDAIERR